MKLVLVFLAVAMVSMVDAFSFRPGYTGTHPPYGGYGGGGYGGTPGTPGTPGYGGTHQDTPTPGPKPSHPPYGGYGGGGYGGTPGYGGTSGTPGYGGTPGSTPGPKPSQGLNGDDRCTFLPGDGVGGTEIKIGSQKGIACIDACITRRRKDPTINGVTVFANNRRSGCWCEKKMKKRKFNRTYKTCFIGQGLNGDDRCRFLPGDGVGGTEIKMGSQKGSACIDACLTRRRKDPTINGVTVFSNNRRSGCWCEKKMKKRNSNKTYKTCFIVRSTCPHTSPRHSTKNGCVAVSFAKRGRLLVNKRHAINWATIVKFAKSLRCDCARVAKEKNIKYFGVHFWGECWELIPGTFKPARNGDCVKANKDYKKIRCFRRGNSMETPCLAITNYYMYENKGFVAPSPSPTPNFNYDTSPSPTPHYDTFPSPSTHNYYDTSPSPTPHYYTTPTPYVHVDTWPRTSTHNYYDTTPSPTPHHDTFRSPTPHYYTTPTPYVHVDTWPRSTPTPYVHVDTWPRTARLTTRAPTRPTRPACAVKTTKGKCCVLPFKYRGKTYNSCTKVNGHKKPWCSTTSIYKGGWGHCKAKKILCASKQGRGYCVTRGGSDQNDGVTRISKRNLATKAQQAKCLRWCEKSKIKGKTGCEAIWGQWFGRNNGCYVHTKEVARGNGAENHSCWTFKKCQS